MKPLTSKIESCMFANFSKGISKLPFTSAKNKVNRDWKNSIQFNNPKKDIFTELLNNNFNINNFISNHFNASKKIMIAEKNDNLYSTNLVFKSNKKLFEHKYLESQPSNIIKRKTNLRRQLQRMSVEVDSVLNLDKWAHEKNLPKDLNEPVNLFYRDKCLKKISDKKNPEFNSSDFEEFIGKLNSYSSEQSNVARKKMQKILKRRTLEFIDQNKDNSASINSNKQNIFMKPWKSLANIKQIPENHQNSEYSNVIKAIKGREERITLNEEALEVETQLQNKLLNFKKLLSIKNAKFKLLINQISELRMKYQKGKFEINNLEKERNKEEKVEYKKIDMKTDKKGKPKTAIKEIKMDNISILQQESEEINKDCLMLCKKRGIMKGKIENIKYEIEKIKSDLSIYFHNILFQGTDSRNEGLSWIIKKLWELGIIVNKNFMPRFIDCDSINYLISISKKEVFLNELLENTILSKFESNKADNIRIKDMKHPQMISSIYGKFFKSKAKLETQKKDKEDPFFEEVSERSKISKLTKITDDEKNIYLIRKEIKEMKASESTRIIREYVKGNYKGSENASIETILNAVLGDLMCKKEMEKVFKYREEYSKLKASRISTFNTLFSNS